MATSVQALTVEPGTADSARVESVPLPIAGSGEVVVRGVAVGVCGTDREIVSGAHGVAPAGRSRLVLGHESLGRVIDAGGSSWSPGDGVVALVRWPDPVPCRHCAVGSWDLCTNGRYLEHGIRGLDGFACQRWAVPADRLVAVPARLGTSGVLVEPASVVAKAWERIDRALDGSGRRCVVITGAGPIGLLASLLGVQRQHDVHVVDIVTDGPKPTLAADLGATYHCGPVPEGLEPEVVIECTGVGEVIVAALQQTARNAVICLTGITSGGRTLPTDVGGINRELVLENDVVLGSVSANRRHYEQATSALDEADADWLRRLITRRVPLARWSEALTPHPGDVKVVVELADACAGPS